MPLGGIRVNAAGDALEFFDSLVGGPGPAGPAGVATELLGGDEDFFQTDGAHVRIKQSPIMEVNGSSTVGEIRFNALWTPARGTCDCET